MTDRDDKSVAEGAEAVAAAARLAGDLARSGLWLASLPLAALPQSVRGPLLDAARWAAEAAAAVPRGIAGAVDGFAADLDELAGRVARREDLGSRLRRERRRAARRGARTEDP